MHSVKKILGAGAAVLCILAGSAIIAPPASAAVGDWNCAFRDGGQLCIRSKDYGYLVWYTNQTPYSDKRLDFNLRCHASNGSVVTYGDEGSFTSSYDWTNSYQFWVGRKWDCQPKLYDYGYSSWYIGGTVS
ncbi:hypothetical protein [Kitasatospora herbaricolor]|uniref:hypothetical protein n=1 Tax=Kitasatospora herbaricolor TaxID=68217 RepID=UPI0036DDFE1D